MFTQHLGVRVPSLCISGQWDSSRAVPIRDFSLGVGLNIRESSGAFHLVQGKLLRARNVDVTGKEMERVWGNPWKKTFAISIISPPTLGGQGFIS